MASTYRDKFDLTGKVAIVTGASRGIGESMARGLAEFGARVVIASRKQEDVDHLVAGRGKKEGEGKFFMNVLRKGWRP